MKPIRSSWTAPWMALLSLALAACAATTLDGTWTRPEFAGKRIDGPVMVVGVVRDETVRRVYEDDLVAKLEARGVKAVRSYDVVPGVLGGDDFQRLTDAARKAGARYLLSSAVIGQDRELVVTQDPGPYWGFGGYRGWYGAYWGLSYPVRTDVRAYNVYIAQTSLADVAGDRIEWTARTRTTDPSNVEKEAKNFADVILGAMAEAGLIAGGK